MKQLSCVLLVITLFLLSASVLADKGSGIVTGEHWVDSSLAQKRAFLFGVGNVLVIERAMEGEHFERSRGHSIVPVLLEGMSGVSIENIVIQLDKFYEAHPDQTKRAVIEVLYLEMALPNLKAARS